jgi:hypothetical protein
VSLRWLRQQALLRRQPQQDRLRGRSRVMRGAQKRHVAIG